MKNIYELKINGFLNSAIGIDIKDITFSFKATFGEKFDFNIYNIEKKKIHSENISIENIGSFKVDFNFENATEYFCNVMSEEVESDFLRFETADVLEHNFITTVTNITCPKFIKDFEVGEFEKARLYITGLGLYRAFVNGEKVGDSFLTPFFNDYDAYLRYQSYDITSLLKEQNKIEVVLGDGWYKGRIGLDGHGGNTFGDKYLLNAKIVIYLKDGSKKYIYTDESWESTNSTILDTSIYDGETCDENNPISLSGTVKFEDENYNLVPDFSPLVKNKIEIKPSLYISPSGEQILDFGQNMVGFCRFLCKEKKGTKIQLLHGEVLQNKCFYNANLRTAKAEYNFISNGVNKVVEPFFTYYGFRYIKVTGIKKVNPLDFTGVVLYSDLESTLEVKSSDSKINKLMENALWGQRGNFLDIPTDCNQRDERMGWTADTQVFVNTASYNMHTLEFYKKFMRDMRVDQSMYYDGDIPMYSPSLKKSAGNGGAVWADAGTIVPWNVYMAYGDKFLLNENYEMMRDYIETVIKKDIDEGFNHIIKSGFTFGDWLAQDGVCEQAMIGGTDNSFIISVYYFNSLNLVAKASEVLNKLEDYKKYSNLAEEVKKAILEEFFTKTGRLALTTQTAYVLALKYEIYIDKNRLITEFKDRLNKDFYKIKSGFTGTPLMLNVLFENGMEDIAYRMLFNENHPGWLYQINLGATTIWERWNSLLPDGRISGTNMNSLNHYAYGSVCEAIYAHIGGLKNNAPGWKKVIIAPKPNFRMKQFEINYNSQIGLYKVKWILSEKGDFKLDITIPYGAEAEIILPNHPEEKVLTVGVGNYSFEYKPTVDYLQPFNIKSLAIDLVKNEEACNILRKEINQAYEMMVGENEEFLLHPLEFFGYLDMFGTNPIEIKEVAKKLEEIVC